MRKYTFDEVKMSHAGMLRAKERLISKARSAASRQGVIGKAEFAVLVAALFLYEIWFSLIVYAHLAVKRVLPGKRMTKVAIIALTVMVFFGIAAFASSSKNNTGAGEKEDVATESEEGKEAEDEIASLQKAKAEAAEEALTQEKAEAEAAEEATSIEETTADEENAEASNEEVTDDEEAGEVVEEVTSTEKVAAKEVKAADETKHAATENAAAVTENETADSASVVNETEAANVTNDVAEEADTDNVTDTDNVIDKLTKLKEENSDFYGWITSEDAGIDSAIMFSNSRPDKYLEKDFNGKRDKNGLPSIVDEVRGDLSSIIIYAGNVDGNGKFAGILKYADGDCDGTITIDTLEGSREFKIITGFTESDEAKDDEALKHIGDDAKTGDCFLVLVTGTTEGRRFYIVAKSL